MKISQKSLTLEVGKSKTLKISGTTKKVTWTSNKKTVAAVSSTGKVTAKKAGSAVITATVNKKKYTCKVTVKNAKSQTVVNPLIKNAPFKAQETTQGKLKFIIPTTWKQEVAASQGNTTMLLFSPVDGNTETGYSNITVVSTETGQKGPAYEALKPVLEEAITAELITSQLAQQGITATITDFKTSDSDTELGKAFKIEYTVNLEESTFTQTIYEIYIDNYNLEIAITDIGDGVTPDVNVVGEYLIKSLTISK